MLHSSVHSGNTDSIIPQRPDIYHIHACNTNLYLIQWIAFAPHVSANATIVCLSQSHMQMTCQLYALLSAATCLYIVKMANKACLLPWISGLPRRQGWQVWWWRRDRSLPRRRHGCIAVALGGHNRRGRCKVMLGEAWSEEA